MKTRSPTDIIKLYDWLWHRAYAKKLPLFLGGLSPNALCLTERCILLLTPQMIPIHKVINSAACRRAILKIIHSN